MLLTSPHFGMLRRHCREKHPRTGQLRQGNDSSICHSILPSLHQIVWTCPDFESWWRKNTSSANSVVWADLTVSASGLSLIGAMMICTYFTFSYALTDPLFWRTICPDILCGYFPHFRVLLWHPHFRAQRDHDNKGDGNSWRGGVQYRISSFPEFARLHQHLVLSAALERVTSKGLFDAFKNLGPKQ